MITRGALRSRPGSVIDRLPMASTATSRPIVCAAERGDIVRCLLAGAVAVAHDAAPAPGGAAEVRKQRRSELQVRFDGGSHAGVLGERDSQLPL